MKLITYCKSCSKPTTIKSQGILLRRDLEERHGEFVQYQCSHCLLNNKVHPNQIYAENSKLPMLLTSIIGLGFILGGFFVKYIIGYYTFWMFTIGGMVLTAGFFSSSSSNSKAFNKSFI